MIYRLIKLMVKLALQIFCRKMSVTGSRFLETPGPLLITANHPNSFFDAILIGALFKRPVHFLARGDAFTKPWHSKMLRMLHMIPIYRLSEGKENLGLNEKAFRTSKEILSTGGIVLIFIEGICVNKHELQPFKKGAARIASENKALPGFSILPVSLAYDSFCSFGKIINIILAPPINAKTFFIYEEEPKNSKHFNTLLFDVIGQNIAIPHHKAAIAPLQKGLLFIPAAIGMAIHFLPYLLIKKMVRAKTRSTVFYDSVLFGVLLMVYPFFVLLICAVLYLSGIPVSSAVLLSLSLPIFARCAVVYKKS